MKQDKQILARDNKKELLKKIDEFKEKLKKPKTSEPAVINQETEPEIIKTAPVTDNEEVELPVYSDPLASRERKTKILVTIMASLIIFMPPSTSPSAARTRPLKP